MYLDLTGQPVRAGTVPPGRRWWVDHLDPATWPSYFGREHGVAWRSLPGTLRGVSEAAWFAHDDPRPWRAMLAARCRQVGARRLGRLGRRA